MSRRPNDEAIEIMEQAFHARQQELLAADPPELDIRSINRDALRAALDSYYGESQFEEFSTPFPETRRVGSNGYLVPRPHPKPQPKRKEFQDGNFLAAATPV